MSVVLGLWPEYNDLNHSLIHDSSVLLKVTLNTEYHILSYQWF